MHVGTIFSQADSGTDADAIRQWAITAEAAGFHHVMAYDHVLGATLERLTGSAIGQFGDPPYTDQSTFHEILTLFAHLAGVTRHIEFVPSVIVLPQRQAQLVAKQVATVDRLSGGRLHVAVGVGWNHAEYEAMGVDFADRTAILDEQITLLRLLLTPADRHVRRPVPPPRPGRDQPAPRSPRSRSGWGRAAPTRRCGASSRTADGWMPLILAGVDPEPVGERVRRLRHLCEDAGRDPATLPVWGRVYVDPTDSWKAATEEAVELGFTPPERRVQPVRPSADAPRRAPRHRDPRARRGPGDHRLTSPHAAIGARRPAAEPPYWWAL